MIEKCFYEHKKVLEKTLQENANQISKVADICIKKLTNGNKILIFGNGGSAADAQHIAAEMVGSFGDQSRIALPAIALTTDTSALTSISNDFGYEFVFARQIEALANSGDIVIGISTSGNSVNIVNGLQAAKDKNCVTIGFSGNVGGKMNELCEENIVIPSKSTPRIQEMHILLGHIICEIIDSYFLEKKLQNL